MCLPKGIRNINYTGLWDTHYVDGRLFVSYHLIIPLIFWGRFSAYVSTVSHTTGPCWITPSKKVNGSVGWQCTWETLNEHSQYFSRAAGALCSMALTKKQHKPLGIHRFVCNTQDWEKKVWNKRDFTYKMLWLKGIFWPKRYALMKHRKVQTTRNQLWSTNVA